MVGHSNGMQDQKKKKKKGRRKSDLEDSLITYCTPAGGSRDIITAFPIIEPSLSRCDAAKFRRSWALKSFLTCHWPKRVGGSAGKGGARYWRIKPIRPAAEQTSGVAGLFVHEPALKTLVRETSKIGSPTSAHSASIIGHFWVVCAIPYL